MSFSPKLMLNAPQKEAIKQISCPLLVIAGAGSGKTRVITQKIAYLIDECDYPPKSIVAVTFTNKAAREMATRIQATLPGKCKGLQISTFHTLGLNILKREYKAIGLKANFTLFDNLDSMNLIKEINLQNPQLGDEHLAELAHQISTWKSNHVLPGIAVSHAKDPHELSMAYLYVEYEKYLRSYNAVDFEDLITLPVQMFDQNPKILEKWQNKIRYILVDEYQDTNMSQYLLLKQLAGVRAQFTVVGDDDQSVYAWRGANPENLQQLQVDFPTLKVIKLEQNYRSTGNILHTANHLIKNNPHVFEKKLWSESGMGEPVKILTVNDDEHEVERVIHDIIHTKFQRAADNHDFAILYRSNHQSRPFEKALREQGIPYKISGGTSFFAKTEVKDIMAYLRLLVNPDDDAAFLRCINTPKREIGPKTIESLGMYAKQREINLFHACTEMGLQSYVNEKTYQKLENFAKWMVMTEDNAKRGNTVDVLKQFITEIDYQSYAFDTSLSPKMAEKKCENVDELMNWIYRLLEEDDTDLGKVINKLMLIDILDRNDEEHKSDSVQLTTLHAAKGLEYPYVYLIGLEEECLPHKNSIEADTIEEERRLLYVGITRAREQLTLIHAKKRKRYGEIIDSPPSRFIEELPKESTQREGHVTASPEKQKEQGVQTLGALRALLAQEGN